MIRDATQGKLVIEKREMLRLRFSSIASGNKRFLHDRSGWAVEGGSFYQDTPQSRKIPEIVTINKPIGTELPQLEAKARRWKVEKHSELPQETSWMAAIRETRARNPIRVIHSPDDNIDQRKRRLETESWEQDMRVDHARNGMRYVLMVFGGFVAFSMLLMFVT